MRHAKLLNCNESQSNAVTASLGGFRKLLPAADFILEVKWKYWVLQKHWKCLAWKANVKCVTSRLLFLSGQISPLSSSWIFPLGRMSRSSSSLPKPFHTHHNGKYLLVSHRFPSEEINLPFASLFQFIYLFIFIYLIKTCCLCQRGANSPWAAKVLGQISSLPSAWYSQGKKSQGMTEQSLQFGWIRRN